MKVMATAEVFKRIDPNLKIVFIKAEGIDNHSKRHESLHLLHEVERLIRLSFNEDTVKSHHLLSPWVAAQQEFGESAKHYHTSVETLIHRVLKRKSVASGDTLTNLMNYIALKYIIPLGVDDFRKIQGDLTFALARGGEGAKLLWLLKPKTFYYHDDVGVLGTKLDHWKSSRTKLTSKSTSVLIHLEVLLPLTTSKQHEIVDELKELITSFCGGKVKVGMIHKRKAATVI